MKVQCGLLSNSIFKTSEPTSLSKETAARYTETQIFLPDLIDVLAS